MYSGVVYEGVIFKVKRSWKFYHGNECQHLAPELEGKAGILDAVKVGKVWYSSRTAIEKMKREHRGAKTTEE